MILLSSLLLASAAAPAQEMVGASWDGTAYSVDSATGAGVYLGYTGFCQIDGMAKSPGGVFFAIANCGISSSLITIDPVSGVGTLVASIPLAYIQGISFDDAGTLWAINNPVNGSYFEVYTINTSTGAPTYIGSTGISTIYFQDWGLAYSNSKLYGYHSAINVGVGLGLVTISTVNGSVTDVNPAIGDTGEIFSMCSSPAGQLYGSGQGIYTLDAITGAAFFIGSGSGHYPDLSGGTEFYDRSGPTLSKTGTCPGSMTVGVVQCTPNSPVALLHGLSGSYTKPNGGCAGTMLSISNPTLATMMGTNGAGAASLTFNALPGYCGRTLQAVDIATCNTTNPIRL